MALAGVAMFVGAAPADGLSPRAYPMGEPASKAVWTAPDVPRVTDLEIKRGIGEVVMGLEKRWIGVQEQGEYARIMRQRTKLDSPVAVVIEHVRTVPDQTGEGRKCSRIAMSFVQEPVKDDRYIPIGVGFDMNLCDDGGPPAR